MDENLVTVATFHSMLEAAQARAQLEEQGITAVVQNSADSGEEMGTAALRVAANDVDRALQALGLLDEDPGAVARAAARESPDVRCPVCGSEFVAQRRPGLFDLIFWTLLALMIPALGSRARARYTCQVCTSQWREGDETEIPKLG